MSQNKYPGIDARLVSIVRIKSLRLLGRYGICKADLDDLAQEWISAAIQTAEYRQSDHPRFTTFIGRIIDRLIIREIRRRKAAKRSYDAEAYSLDEYIQESDESATHHQAFSEEDYLEMTGSEFRDHRQVATDRHDAEAFLETLSPDLRELAHHLKTHAMEQVPEAAGISRATAFRRLQKLRAAAVSYFSEES